jgi:hypothetical protein
MMNEQTITIKLDRDEVRLKIGKNFGGGLGKYGWAYYLIVNPNGAHRIAACEDRCWNDSDYVAALPAPYGDGRGDLSELADDMLRAEGLSQEPDEGSIAAAERQAPEVWREWVDESLEWFAQEWMRALNGSPNDLDIDAPFGVRESESGDLEFIECPYRFGW